MIYNQLGGSPLTVSRICLGTMTWGEQNSEREAHQQLDYAIDQGINFIDTAEMYPVPPKAETQGLTERYLGTWLKKQKRDELIIATKVTGRSQHFNYLRGGTRLSKVQIKEAVEGNLRRLQTDYIDLYQIHWPDRITNYFGALGYTHHDGESIPIQETLEAMAELIQEGKIGYVGISNETPWGVMEYLRCAREMSLPRVVTIQNPYNLLNRTFEIGLSEIAHRENIGLLAYSPMAFGYLSGKYLHGQRPPAGRITKFQRFARYSNSQSERATELYVDIAKRYEMDPAQMSLAFVNQQPFVAANIIGATTMEQLKSNIASIDLDLPQELLTELEKVHVQQPNPAP